MQLIVISGPPCAGKTTHVQEHRQPGDLVLDLDTLAHALGYPTPHIDHAQLDDHPARTAALTARASILKHRGRWTDNPATLWIIDTDGRPLPGAEIRTIDPGADVCHQRATLTGRHESTHAQIDQWYARHHPGSRDW